MTTSCCLVSAGDLHGCIVVECCTKRHAVSHDDSVGIRCSVDPVPYPEPPYNGARIVCRKLLATTCAKSSVTEEL